MKVITAQTMQEVDRTAINDFGIPGITLMENAGRLCAEEILAAYGDMQHKQAVVLAGKGNNGGDGYVIARHLLQNGWQVQVIVLARQDEIKGDALLALNQLEKHQVCFCTDTQEFISNHQQQISEASLLVDALLGTGLSHALCGVYLEAVRLINRSQGVVVAVDIPSGINGTTGKLPGEAVKADLTVTFACIKAGHLLYPGADYVGQLQVVDIGIPQTVLNSAKGYEFIDEAAATLLLKPRQRTAHKGDCGHCLVVAGSSGKSGAAVLAANSAVRAGAGLVTLAVPQQLHQTAEIKTTEVMTVPLSAEEPASLNLSALPVIQQLLADKDMLALGPGIGTHPETISLVQQLVKTITTPMVIDADGLNAIAKNPELLLRKAAQTLILTPHPGEMARLCNITTHEVNHDRIAIARDFASKYGVYQVLKGARTIMAAPDGRVAINASGNPGMASGGMGDLLTGIISALLAQKYDAWTAVRLGVFVHGMAGDLVAEKQGEIGMNATDLQEMLPYVYKRLLSRRE